MKTATFVVAAMLAFGASGTNAQGPAATSCDPNSDGVIGEWRDRIGDFWDVRMRIVDDGSTLVLLLDQEPASSFRRTGMCRFAAGDAGDRYVINRRGDLDLYDDAGFIRTAIKVRAR